MIAGRYRVEEQIGSAAFSRAVSAIDVLTGQRICIKIMNNEKDLIDQCIDEVKIVRLLNDHDPQDEFHIIRSKHVFYFREHLMIVSDLYGANLYKVCETVWSPDASNASTILPGYYYFNLRTIRRITRQLLVSLWYLRCFGVLHSDIKPENILMEDWSRASVRLIDFGSASFVHDTLTQYAQSRSYRAPEVRLTILRLGNSIPFTILSP